MDPLTNGHAQRNGTAPFLWERLPNESGRAFDAFECYMRMGSSRSTAKVHQEIGKSKRLLDRWSGRHQWTRRAAAWDAHQSTISNKRLADGRAAAMERLIDAGRQLQSRGLQRLSSMTEEELKALHPVDAAALVRHGCMIEGKARDSLNEDEVAGFYPNLPPPKFEIQMICPGLDKHGRPMVGVQLPCPAAPNGMLYGYIPEDRIEELKRDHPDARVIA